jgi:hypothetical protein
MTRKLDTHPIKNQEDLKFGILIDEFFIYETAIRNKQA